MRARGGVEGARTEREVTLKAAAEMTGVSGKVLRRYIREGRLEPASIDGDKLTVTLAGLREAGLLPALPLDVEPPRAAGRAAPAAHPPSRPESASSSALEKLERERLAREKAEREKAEGLRNERARVEAERVARETAEREKGAREAAERERSAREKAEREKAEREKAEREKAEREKAEREKAERARVEREKAEREKAESEKAARTKAERARAERDEQERERARREQAERARREEAEREEAQQAERARVERERAERDLAERERAERAKAERDARRSGDAAPNVVVMRPVAGADEASSAEAEAERHEPEVVPDSIDGELVSGPEGHSSERSSSSLPATAGQWVSAGQIQDLLSRLLSERETRGIELQQRAESLYREMINEQRSRIVQLEEEKRALDAKLQDSLRLIPKGLELTTLEEQNRDLRIELDRRDAAKLAVESERDRLRDLVDRLKSELSRSEKRNLDLAETIRRIRARGLWDRLTGSETEGR